MAYRSIDELPDRIRKHLPVHAQEIYREAFNNASREYADPEKRRGKAPFEEVIHRVAWAAVKKIYRKDEKTGEWIRKNSQNSATG